MTADRRNPRDARREPDARSRDGDAAAAELDAAGRSLADALRISFSALKVAMVVLVVAAALSGTRKVDEGTVAVRLLFGAVRGEPGEQVLEPGGPYLWPPEPIGRFVTVDTTLQAVSLADGESFWFDVPEGTELIPLDQLRPRPLAPGRDGYLLTADKNIVHGQFTIGYRVLPREGVEFVRNVSAGTPSAMRVSARRVVTVAAQRAVVHAVAGVDADDFVRSVVSRESIQALVQAELDRLDTGITVTRVLLDRPTPPLAVRPAFRAVTDAEAEKARTIEEARRGAEEILAQTAGDRHPALRKAIAALEAASAEGDATRTSAAEKELLALLDTDTVQGDVAQRIRKGDRLRQEAEQTILAELEEFRDLREEYERNPRVFRDRHFRAMLERVLAGDVETFYLPAGKQRELWLEVDRDPRIRAAKERARYEDR